MTDGVPPVEPVRGRDRRDAQRRSAERRKAEASRAVVRVQEVLEDPQAEPDPARLAAPLGPESAFAAQLIGQGGQRTGIRGGPPVMGAARSSYLGNEYSGGNDRRPPAGKAKKTEA